MTLMESKNIRGTNQLAFIGTLLGLVIATGLAIGTLFTLFVVPAVYMVLAEDHHDKKPDTSSV